MTQKRNRYSGVVKFRLALEAAKEQQTLNELSSAHGVHPNQISPWKRPLLEEGPHWFDRQGVARQHREQAAREAELYEPIGRLKMELDWVKKKLPRSLEMMCVMIEPTHPDLSIRRQCELIGLHRSNYYCQPASETPLNLELMRLIDRQYTKTPYFGWPKMTVYLQGLGYAINHKRIQRLMQKMGLQAIVPQPRMSQPTPQHKVYPYLLRHLEVTHPNQVWATDITYIPLPQGFMYLVAIMDWFSRYVVSWSLSNSLESHFCVHTLQEALQRQGKPAIFNSDQGSQCTAAAFTSVLNDAGIRISMDGRGRCFDNIFVERLWRSVKYEDIYPKAYDSVPALTAGLGEYFPLYNEERPHQSLSYRVPAEVYFAG